MNQLQISIHNHFKNHRIVFWYDLKKELRSEFEEMILPGIEMIELNNNEFGIKHLVLKEKPDQKFLIYYEGPQPDDLDNWLLDVQLAYATLNTDQTALWMADIGLADEFLKVLQDHLEFFNSENRRSRLKAVKSDDDTASTLMMKMVSICTGTEPRLNEILEELLKDLADKKNEKYELIRRFALKSFLWDQTERYFGYKTGDPSIPDFAIELFQSCYFLMLGLDSNLGKDTLVFLKRWKDSISHHEDFEKLSKEYAEVLNIEKDLAGRNYKSLVELDLFEEIDKKIISDLSQDISKRTITRNECSEIIRKRRLTHWFKNYLHFYEALDNANNFIALLDELDLTIHTLDEGIQKYTKTWFRLDQYYRKFIYHTRKSGNSAILEKVNGLVEKLYSNNYLLKLNNSWQQVLDKNTTWGFTSFLVQNRFFEEQVLNPFVKNKKKVYVIISDAFRFEAAEEFCGMLRREDRYDVEVKSMVSMLPSYTQLGMAALLPNKSLTISEKDANTILVDGQSSQGTANRDKILKQELAHASALQSSEFLSTSRDEFRETMKENDVFYIYHNRIDAVGDRLESEDKVFEAVEDTFSDLINIIKKLTAANATNIIVTTDHGFIYQDAELDEGDFLVDEVKGHEIIFRN